MNIYCGKCGEPWGIDSLHEEAKERGVTFTQVRQEFRVKGCEAFAYGSHNTVVNAVAAETSAMLQDLFGDDVYVIAAFSDDFRNW